jgi:Leu/Phe-tRNA-protein transferase
MKIFKPTQADLDRQRILRDSWSTVREVLTSELMIKLFLEQGYILDERAGDVYKLMPRERCIVELISPIPHMKSKQIKKSKISLTTNRALPEVLARCAIPRTRHVEGEGAPRVWIGPYIKSCIKEAGSEAYRRKYPHACSNSIEAWREDKIVGGAIILNKNGLISIPTMYGEYSGAVYAICILLHQIALTAKCQAYDVQLPSNIAYYMGGKSLEHSKARQILQVEVEREFEFPTFLTPIPFTRIAEIFKDEDGHWQAPDQIIPSPLSGAKRPTLAKKAPGKPEYS